MPLEYELRWGMMGNICINPNLSLEDAYETVVKECSKGEKIASIYYFDQYMKCVNLPAGGQNLSKTKIKDLWGWGPNSRLTFISTRDPYVKLGEVEPQICKRAGDVYRKR